MSNFRETNPGWILESKVTPFSSKKTLNLGGKLYHLGSPLVMAILNVTPDSFYDGNRLKNPDALGKKLDQFIAEGTDIIDIGGYSTRPGAKEISVQEELDRVLPAIEKARSCNPDIPLSIDTFRSSVAKAALDAGAVMINDISGGSLDRLMFRTVAERNVPYVLMHMRGDPGTMTSLTSYHNLITEVMEYFNTRVEQLLKMGVKDVLIDPGFGFAKTTDQNYVLLKNLGYFKQLNIPLLVGLSRKSMIYKTLKTSADEALTGTCVLNTIALMNGASILRVHDVRAARETVELFKRTYL